MRLFEKLAFRLPAVKAMIRERELLQNSLRLARQKLALKDQKISTLRQKLQTQSTIQEPHAAFGPTHDIAIFVKSYSFDFNRLQQLVSSYRKFATSIPLLISVPEKEVAEAKGLFGPDIHVIADEEYTVFGEHPHFYGWLNQQLCKLSLFKIGFAKSYFVLDSDCYFLREVSKNDFIDESGNNYSIFSTFNSNYRWNGPYFHDFLRLGEKYWPASEPNHSDPSLNISELKPFIANLANPDPSVRGSWIRKIFGANHSLSFMPCPIVNSTALQSLYEEFCVPNGLTLSDLIAISPWEFNWYGEWLLYRKPIPLIQKDPLAAHFPSETAVDAFVKEGFTAADLSARFAVVAMASRHYDRINI